MGEREGGIPLPGWIWLGLLLAALGLRLVWFGNFPNWPLYDEMINGYFAMRLDQHWDWHPFFFWTQLPPFLIWALALLFKVIPSTLTAIRVLPFLLSVLILPLTYGSVRNFFPKSTSFLYLAVVSTGFGFLYFGRICHQGLLLLLWEFMVFYCVGKFMRTTTQSENSFWLVICGITIGTGFYTYFSWPVVGLMMTIPLLLNSGGSRITG